MDIRKRRSRQEWRQILDEWKSTGLTARQFAETRGLRTDTLRWWASALRREPKDSRPPEVHFLELAPTDSAIQKHAFELKLRNGQQLSFSDSVHFQRLASIVKALEEC